MRREPDFVKVDNYVSDVLLRDLVGHDKRPAAFLVYLYLYACASRSGWRPVAASLLDLAEATGLSKSAVEVSMKVLRRRRLISTESESRTARPRHRVRRHWKTG